MSARDHSGPQPIGFALMRVFASMAPPPNAPIIMLRGEQRGRKLEIKLGAGTEKRP